VDSELIVSFEVNLTQAVPGIFLLWKTWNNNQPSPVRREQSKCMSEESELEDASTMRISANRHGPLTPFLCDPSLIHQYQ
jgi:hypothetical protein